MTVDIDIQNVIKILYGDESNPEYKKVKIFPNHSLKHFKKYKLNNKEVLSRINSLDEILDLLSYNSIVTCFSTNKLDRYFLKLLVQMHNIERKKYMDYIFEDYGKKGKILSKKYYDMIKDNLDDQTRYFFDELYNHCLKSNISISKLIEKQKYEKKIYDMYVKNYLLGKYDDVLKNNKLTVLRINDTNITNVIFENRFDLINLSYEFNEHSDIKKLLEKEQLYKKLLNENGKIQGFVSFENLDLKDHKIISTRSFLDPYTDRNNCKKEYAYMYKNSQK
ncbi:MAG: hypothetical protein IJ105_00565 [Bacilli bacterium]|nr:hypothetical protein [Bacilli bacterium]